MYFTKLKYANFCKTILFFSSCKINVSVIFLNFVHPNKVKFLITYKNKIGKITLEKLIGR